MYLLLGNVINCNTRQPRKYVYLKKKNTTPYIILKLCMVGVFDKILGVDPQWVGAWL